MLTLSKTRGIGGLIKQKPEDFKVMEITGGGQVLKLDTTYTAQSLGETESPEGKFITFVMQKYDWDTIGALTCVAKRMGRGRKSIGYAGVKDKMAITAQLCSVFHPGPFDMSSFKLKDITINGSWRGSEVKLGSNLGNAFEVMIRGASDTSSLDGTVSELAGRIPNYFGPQRFGERGTNAKIGLMLLRGDIEGAMIEYLTNSENERNPMVIEARGKLKADLDFKAALGYFPRFLRGERTVIAKLAEEGSNYARAFRMLPRGMMLMFIHAVQDTLFNAELDSRVGKKDFDSPVFAQTDLFGFPDMEQVNSCCGAFPVSCIIGYDTKDEEISEYTRGEMEKMGLKKEDFKIKSLPELSMKGTYRTILAPVRDLSYKAEGEDVSIGFSLPKGSYATVLLNEFMK